MLYKRLTPHKNSIYYCHAFTMTTALVFLFALLLIGLGSIRSSVMQERMVGNGKDMNLAFQAAESALRDAEEDVMENMMATTAFTSACSNGLCLPSTMQVPVSNTPVWDSVDWNNSAVTRYYGQYTGAAALPGVAAQPKYIIEKISSVGAAIGESVGMGIQPIVTGQAYRITVYATGARAETHLTLQSVFSKR
jgi:type IV pilus assembly protein PilX